VAERVRRSHGTLFHCAMIVHCDGMRLKGAGLVLFLGLMTGWMVGCGWGGTELETIRLREEVETATVEVGKSAPWLGYKLEARIDCEGQACTPSSSSSTSGKMAQWKPTFEVSIEVVKDGEVVVPQANCDPANYYLVSNDRDQWDASTFVGRYSTKVKLNGCASQIAEPGRYEVHAKLVAKDGQEVQGWTSLPGGKLAGEDSRVRFSEVTLIPTAYKNDGAAGN